MEHPYADRTEIDPDDPQHRLKEAIGDWLITQQLNGVEPVPSAALMFGAVYDSMVEAMGRAAVRAALLIVYERSHDDPMSFIQRNEAKALLDNISNARRKVEGGSALILPGTAH